MSEAMEKVREAEYFLERMRFCQEDRDAFKFNLSAFLSAMRSVRDVMHSEFKRAAGFEKWEKEKFRDMRSDRVTEVLDKKRNLTVHQRSVQPEAQVDVGISEHITVSDRVSVVIRHADGTAETRESPPEPSRAPEPEPTATVEWRWYFAEIPQEDVVSLGEKGLLKLRDLVSTCEATFGQPSKP